jgi:hypothetical protein
VLSPTSVSEKVQNETCHIVTQSKPTRYTHAMTNEKQRRTSEKAVTHTYQLKERQCRCYNNKQYRDWKIFFKGSELQHSDQATKQNMTRLRKTSAIAENQRYTTYQYDKL